MILLSHSRKDTEKIAHALAKELRPSGDRAIVLALEGNLGAGKTTFVQALSCALGIRERVLSPTFVLMKVYAIPCRMPHVTCRKKIQHLVHIDCYHLDSKKALSHLGLKEIFKDPDALVVIEWADHIRTILPKHTRWIQFKHGKSLHERIVTIQQKSTN